LRAVARDHLEHKRSALFLPSAAEKFVDRQQQLPDLPVFELHQNGGCKLNSLSVRDLY
jgi:hypothetical protein